VIFRHSRARRNVSLLAAGLLSGREQAEARAHLAACARCRAEAEALAAVVRELEADPVRSAEPGIPAAVLASRVLRQADEARVSPARPRWLAVALPAAAALAALALLGFGLAERWREERPAVARAPIPPAEASLLLSEDALARIERNLAREQAARYLNEAGEVLVAVAATGVDCDRIDDRLDVGAAPERSRELLEKRRLVDASGEAVASARAVLDDVELALRQVAELPACVKRRDVEHVQKDVEERQLLMRIRLLQRELEG
jgi:hypothetical protein